MNDAEQIKREFHEEVTGLLSSFPEVLHTFDQTWRSGNFRESYLIVHNAIRQFGLESSLEQSKVWEDFYWLFVN